MATQLERMGGIRAIVIGGFNEHSAEVHRFIENAATAGASRVADANEETVADARARLRKQFRQRMSIGAWKDRRRPQQQRQQLLLYYLRQQRRQQRRQQWRWRARERRQEPARR